MLDKVTAYATNALTHIDFSGLILPLIVYSLLIAAYAVFVWAFYKSVSKRNLFALRIADNRKKWQYTIFYIVKYLILFPILTFLWFAAMTIIMFFLSKSQTTENILLISMALIAAARVTSYYKEEIAQEIAKMLPLAVLGIFMVDPTFFSLGLTINRFYQLPSMYVLLINYLLFTIVLEFVLRILLAIGQRIRKVEATASRVRKKKQY